MSAGALPPDGNPAAAAPSAKTPPAAPAGKPPVAATVGGVITLLVGLVSLCGGGIRVLDPGGGLDPGASVTALDVPGMRLAFYLSITVWIAVCAVAIACGALLLAGRRTGRTLGLVYAWTTVAATIAIPLVYAVKVIPGLVYASVSPADILRIVSFSALTGCCPTVWAVAFLAILYNDAVVQWARSVT